MLKLNISIFFSVFLGRLAWSTLLSAWLKKETCWGKMFFTDDILLGNLKSNIIIILFRLIILRSYIRRKKANNRVYRAARACSKARAFGAELQAQAQAQTFKRISSRLELKLELFKEYRAGSSSSSYLLKGFEQSRAQAQNFQKCRASLSFPYI